MKLALIVAVSADRVIGRDNDLPWRLPADLKRFKQLTMGHPLIMGRRTHESIGRPLPGRQNIVISRNPAFRADGCLAASSLDDALDRAGDAEQVFVIGGAALYEAALPRADLIYRTRVEGEFSGDVWFPEFDEQEWELVESESHPAGDSNPHPHVFELLRRRRAS